MQTRRKRVEWWLDKPDSYWVHTTKYGYIKVAGEPVQIDGFGELDVFAISIKGLWGIVSGVTGCVIADNPSRVIDEPVVNANRGDYARSKNEAIERCTRGLQAVWSDRQFMRDRLTFLVVTLGLLSPRYRLETYEDDD